MFRCCSSDRDDFDHLYDVQEKNPKIEQLKHYSSVVLQVIFVGGSIIVAIGMIPAGVGLAGLTISSTPYFMFVLGNGLTFYGIGALLGGGSLAIVGLAIYSCVKGIKMCCKKSESEDDIFAVQDDDYGKPSAPPYESVFPPEPSAPPYEPSNTGTYYYPLVPAQNQQY